MGQRHIHLQPLGGVAGDMFVAAMLDALPGAEAETLACVRRVVAEAEAAVALEAARDCGLTGRRFRVTESRPTETGHAHVHWSALRRRIESTGLPAGVMRRTLAIFQHLAEAEARVHGVPPGQVAFHEVGAVDSLVDIVAAAALIEAAGACGWSCEPLPLGQGTVMSTHGRLPVPAPATTELLRGMPTVSDGLEGERVTPTGAAIVRHLEPAFMLPARPGRLAETGTGFGRRSLPGMPNMLRVLIFETEAADAGLDAGAVGLVEFEVDDQSPEDLAVALDRLRRQPMVRDVVQYPVTGKKGRLSSAVRLLTDPDAVQAVAAACLEETRTLGLRWSVVNRLSVPRRTVSVDGPAGTMQVKIAQRPGGTTAKAESDDVREIAGSHRRDEVRRMAEQKALKQLEKDP